MVSSLMLEELTQVVEAMVVTRHGVVCGQVVVAWVVCPGVVVQCHGVLLGEVPLVGLAVYRLAGSF